MTLSEREKALIIEGIHKVPNKKRHTKKIIILISEVFNSIITMEAALEA